MTSGSRTRKIATPSATAAAVRSATRIQGGPERSLAGPFGDSSSARPMSGARNAAEYFEQQAEAEAEPGAGGAADIAALDRARQEAPGEDGEERHADVEREEMRVAQVDDRAGEQERREDAGQSSGHMPGDDVHERNGRRAERRRDRPAEHHVGDFVARDRQIQRMGERFVHADDQVQQVRRPRRVHEELRRHRRGVRIAREQIRVREDEVLVDVEVEVGRAPGEAVEAERRAERGRDGQPEDRRSPTEIVRRYQIRLRRNDHT